MNRRPTFQGKAFCLDKIKNPKLQRVIRKRSDDFMHHTDKTYFEHSEYREEGEDYERYSEWIDGHHEIPCDWMDS